MKFHTFARDDLIRATENNHYAVALCGYKPRRSRWTEKGWAKMDKKVEKARTKGIRECRKCARVRVDNDWLDRKPPVLQTWAEIKSAESKLITWWANGGFSTSTGTTNATYTIEVGNDWEESN